MIVSQRWIQFDMREQVLARRICGGGSVRVAGHSRRIRGIHELSVRAIAADHPDGVASLASHTLGLQRIDHRGQVLHILR